MRRIVTLGVLIGTFGALLTVEAIAVEQKPGVGSGGAVTPQPRAVTPQTGGVAKPPGGTVVPFECGQATCTCKGATDCFNMGAAGVCGGIITEGGAKKPGTAWCARKQ